MDNLEDVEDLTSLWNFDESIDDLNKQLQSMMNELAKARKEAIEQAKINKEKVKKLIHLLGIAYKERDHARDQLRKLSMVKPYTLPRCSLPKTLSPTTKINDTNKSLKMINNNSAITSYSKTSSSSRKSYFDVMSSPNANYGSISYDHISTMMEDLAEGKPRAKKGKFLESVMEAGPLLDSLMVAGSLPKWLSPPQVVHAQQVPPMPISMNKRPRYNESLEY